MLRSAAMETVMREDCAERTGAKAATEQRKLARTARNLSKVKQRQDKYLLSTKS